ncbi:MAG: hypothetical protein PSV22_14310, partial [Pseudolabrys sp.]|nr:hypothetical protein [Pseudolabrys sp.]
TTRGMALRRLWPAAFVNAPLAISTSDGGTLPTAGRTINISGSFPGRKEFIYRGNAKNFQTLTPNIWDGSAASTPFGAAGWTHVGFMSATPNKGVQTFRVMHPDLSQVLCAVEIDDGVGKTIKINGTTVMSTVSEVPNDTRFQVIVSLKGGQAVVTIHNLSTDSKNSQMVRTFAVSSIYVAGNAIGPAKINSTCAATANAWVAHGAVGVWSKFCVVSGDSFSSSAILEQYAVSGVVTGTKTITVATMGTRIPTAGDKLFWTGSAGAVNDGVYTVASATATTIVTVEVIPNSSATGSIDLVYPRYHTTSQRLGVYIPATGDCDAIPDHYDPCPFGMDALAGFHELLNMARSGGKMSEDIANVLPQCTNIPNPWFIAQCFVVNDTTATVSESAMNTQAISLAAQAKAYAQWVVDRGGKIVLTDAPNSPDAGVVMNGTANRFRRRTMAQVSVHLPRLLADIKASAGSVLYAPIIRRLDSNAVIMTDGLHIDASTGVLLGYELHASLQALKGADGFNTDGSIKAVAASGAGQGVMRSVMGTA